MPDPKDDEDMDDSPIGLQEDGSILVTPPGEPPPPFNPEVVGPDGKVYHPEQEDADLIDDYEAFLDDEDHVETADDAE